MGDRFEPRITFARIKVIPLDTEKTLSLLKKLRSLMGTPSEYKSREPFSILEKLRSLIITPLKEKSKETRSLLKIYILSCLLLQKKRGSELLEGTLLYCLLSTGTSTAVVGLNSLSHYKLNRGENLRHYYHISKERKPNFLKLVDGFDSC